jgi:hypothetical protein
LRRADDPDNPFATVDTLRLTGFSSEDKDGYWRCMCDGNVFLFGNDGWNGLFGNDDWDGVCDGIVSCFVHSGQSPSVTAMEIASIKRFAR